MENREPVDQVNVNKIKRTLTRLEKNFFTPYYAENTEELKKILTTLIKEEDTVSVGGSMTLAESGVTKFLQEGPYKFLARSDYEDMREFFIACIQCDTFLTSVNAVTETGWLLSVDGIGNRVASTIFGPESVIIIAGVNKIVRTVEDAFERIKQVAAPANNIRLNTGNPCTKTGTCMNCKEDTRICTNYVLIGPQRLKDRTKIILVNENLGY